MLGRYSNDNNSYVEYMSDSKSSVTTKYNLPHDKSSQFKLDNGVHYHKLGDEWKKQWIFEREAPGKYNVYNYISKKVYSLELK